MTEQRKYVRMNTVFPVEFDVLSDNGERRSSQILQGFTRDVSAGGICIEFKSFGKEAEQLLDSPDGHLELTINPPFARHPIKANGRIAWLKKDQEHNRPKYIIGVAYTRIDEKARLRIIRYAKRLIWVPRLAAVAGLIVLIVAGGLFLHNQQLMAYNSALVTQLVEGAERKSGVATNLFELQERRRVLIRELTEAQTNIQEMESAIASLAAENLSQKEAYETRIQEILKQRQNINEELDTLRANQDRLRSAYQSLQKTEQVTATEGLRQMYKWIRSHQNLNTGLVASFEGDPSLEDWAFTYDQSLACQTFLLFGDVKNAEAILSFFDKRARREDGAFFNTYDSVHGDAVESIIHVGPNVWIGIAALQYEHRLKNGRFLPLARSVAEWLIRSQDAEGGLKGGPTVSWYSTEHNLDAYAFLRMMYEETGDLKYRRASERVLDWIRKYAYSNKEKRMNRGKGDATIATDTFSWAIAAIGPAKLTEIQFDPEAMMQYAEEHCEVAVQLRQPTGKVISVRGFDFAKAQNLGRGGVISTEWTAQVIVTYLILADYFKALGETQKAAMYRDKVNFYLNNLQKLIITSPSRTGQGRGCLPYASVDNVDTGHGWRTPKGRRTGSVSGTAYGIFAWVGYNPFDLNLQKAVY